MLIKCYIAFTIDLKSFGGQTSKNVQYVRKLVFIRASESLYICLVFKCCFKSINIRGNPRLLIDMLRIKTFGYDSLRTTLKAPKEDQMLDKEDAKSSVQNQNVELPSHPAPGTECACASHALHEVHCLKKYVRQSKRLSLRRSHFTYSVASFCQV